MKRIPPLLAGRNAERDRTGQQYDKPVIAFKIFAGGQMFLGRTEAEIRERIKGAYDEVFTALKPDDIAAIGVFQRDKDELAEDVALYDEWSRSSGWKSRWGIPEASAKSAKGVWQPTFADFANLA